MKIAYVVCVFFSVNSLSFSRSRHQNPRLQLRQRWLSVNCRCATNESMRQSIVFVIFCIALLNRMTRYVVCVFYYYRHRHCRATIVATNQTRVQIISRRKTRRSIACSRCQAERFTYCWRCIGCTCLCSSTSIMLLLLLLLLCLVKVNRKIKKVTVLLTPYTSVDLPPLVPRPRPPTLRHRSSLAASMPLPPSFKIDDDDNDNTNNVHNKKNDDLIAQKLLARSAIVSQSRGATLSYTAARKLVESPSKKST
jgi:hypothetical protein